MITIQSAESALKNIYLDSVITDINTKTNPFLTLVQKNAKTVSGKEARAFIRYGNKGSVASGDEGGDLPINQNGKTAEIISPLKNLYGTFQISDKALRAAANNSSAFSALLTGEMQNLVDAAQKNLNEMIYGNGKRYTAHTSQAPNDTLKLINLPLRFAGAFAVGDIIHIKNANNIDIATVTVTKIEKEGTAVIYSGSIPGNQDRVYLYKDGENTTEELNGIDSIFLQDKIYNLDKAAYGELAPFIQAATTITGDTIEVLNESNMLKFFDNLEEHCQGTSADILLTHPNVRRSIFESLKNMRTNVDTAEFEGGFKGFSFNGIPMYCDVKCKGGTAYALNSDSWAMHQLCDWTWLSGDDGTVLRQIDGKAGYSATLVKYAELICDKPFIQGKATCYSANKVS